MSDEASGRSSDPLKVVSIIGTRPEAIKMAPVVRELERDHGVFASRVCVTGQHKEMLHQMLDLFEVIPDHDLDIMRPTQSLTDVTVAVLEGLQGYLRHERPDWVLVQGDTTTTLAASLAAFYWGARVAHIEAGLRTYDKHHPRPEEMNRRLTGVIADLHFAPTAAAAENLRREGAPAESIVVTGNTIVDALHEMAARPFDPTKTALATVPVYEAPTLLVTAHRRENIGRNIERICGGLRVVAERFPEVQVVFPVHPNPVVRRPVHELLGDLSNVRLLDPLDYQAMVWLMVNCEFVITDSGGIQEEGAALGKPVLVLRDETERPEGVEAGTAQLIGADDEALVEWATRLLVDSRSNDSMAHAINPYGDGHAAEKIVGALRRAGSAPRAPAVTAAASDVLGQLQTAVVTDA